MNYRELWIRWSFFVVGLIVLAFGISLTIKASELGIGPWDVLHYGLYLKLGLTIGSWSIIIGFLLLAITSIITKKLPKIGAVVNMLLLGTFIDIFNLLLPQPVTTIGIYFFFIMGVIILGYGIGLYVAADFGAGPRDGIMLVIVEKTGWKIEWVRNGNEILVFIIGWMLGGPVGIGTLLIAFTLGNIVGVSLPQSKNLLSFFLHKSKLQQASNIK